MGTWGVGNLDSDRASDYLVLEIFKPLETQILSVLDENISAEADGRGDATIVAVDALATLCAHFGYTTSLDKKQLHAIQARFFEVWSASMPGLDPVATHGAARQAEIEKTFVCLLKYTA